MRKHPAILLFLLATTLAFPALGWAQAAAGGIAGVARDESGAVLPGVTVEASSPALIEKVRTAATDAQGNYKIIDLRPGVYSVTFTLPGFSTFRRDGLELTTGFTATVNASMRVGGIEETVTVTGASPTVDVQNVRQQVVMRKEEIEALPVAKNYSAFLAVIPGATLSSSAMQDVGGTQPHFAFMGIHGESGSGVGVLQDGFSFRSAESGFSLRPNPAAQEEVAIQLTGGGADAPTGRVQVNTVPKEGGNAFHVLGIVGYSSPAMQSNNASPELAARGAPEAGEQRKNRNLSAGFGGPIVRDRLWFYTAHMRNDISTRLPGNYYNLTQGTPLYAPDLSRPFDTEEWEQDHQVRLTWQATGKDKVNFHAFKDAHCQCTYLNNNLVAPEATVQTHFEPVHLFQLTWARPANNRLLFEAGANLNFYTADRRVQTQFGVTPDTIASIDLSRNYQYNAVASGLTSASSYGNDPSDISTYRTTMSYVTGSHAFKVGLQIAKGFREDAGIINKDIRYQFRGQTPDSVQYWATPSKVRDEMRDLAVYAQDQWTLSRWTLNLGVRYDSFLGTVPAQQLPAGMYVPARNFAEVKDVPNWKDVTPRLGAAYDLFGNGKTAIKTAIGKYLDWENANTAVGPHNPVLRMVSSATRSWADRNGDFIPQESELGPLSNVNFGQTRPGTTFADDVRVGWGVRDYSWQASVQVQHELRENLGINIGYFRTWFGNFTVSDNLLVTPADYDQYCVAAPRDSQLAGGGGYEICGLYDISPSKFGRSNVLVTQASNFGNQTQVFNGIDATFNLRLARGGSIQGGISTGATVTDNCQILIDSPQKQFCRQSPPWSAGTQVKLSAVYPLAWGFRASATYQHLPGVPIAATHVVRSVDAARSLGRNFAAGANASAVIDLFSPVGQYEDRLNQTNVRFTRIFRMKRTRVQANFDVHNLFNANTVLGINSRYGPSWRQPTAILGARVLKIGFQLDL